MKIYLIRHGQTDWNTEGRIQGSYDSELNENGIRQAKDLGARLLESQVNFSRIYSSKQKRAYKTAEIISNITGKPLERVAGLEEINLGLWEGLTWDEVKKSYPDEFDKWCLDRRYERAPEGESYQEMIERVLMALRKITAINNEAVAVVTHGAVIMGIQCYQTNTSFNELRKFQAKNTSIIEIDSDMLKGEF